MSQLRRSGGRGGVGFGALAAGLLVDGAADVFPIGFAAAMSDEFGEHDVNKTDVARSPVQLIAGDDVPAGVPVVTFAALYPRAKGEFLDDDTTATGEKIRENQALIWDGMDGEAREMKAASAAGVE